MRSTRCGAILLATLALGAAGGRTLAAGDAAAGRDKAIACATCHGIDGNGRVPLAGKDERYLLKRMTAFKRGDGGNPAMQSILAEFTARDLADLAAYFAAQKRR